MAPENHLHGVLAEGARPFRYRAAVRTLLGMPDDGGVPVSFAAALPRPGFRYVRHHGGTAGPGSTPQWWEHPDAGVFEPETPSTTWDSEVGPDIEPVAAPRESASSSGLASDDSWGAGLGDVLPSGTAEVALPAEPLRLVAARPPLESVHETSVVPGGTGRPARENVDQGRADRAARKSGPDGPEAPAALSVSASSYPEGNSGERPSRETPSPGGRPGLVRKLPSVRPVQSGGTSAGLAVSTAMEPVAARSPGDAGSGPAAPAPRGRMPDGGRTVVEPDGSPAPRVAEFPYRTASAGPPAAQVAQPAPAPAAQVSPPSVIVVRPAAPKTGADAFWQRRHLGRLRPGLLR